MTSVPIERLKEILLEMLPSENEYQIDCAVQAWRKEFAGERVGIPKLDITHEQIRREYKGNVKDTANRLGVCESTVRRAVGKRNSAGAR
jgi:ActR/RegA family two-component response regulator